MSSINPCNLSFQIPFSNSFERSRVPKEMSLPGKNTTRKEWANTKVLAIKVYCFHQAAKDNTSRLTLMVFNRKIYILFEWPVNTAGRHAIFRYVTL